MLRIENLKKAYGERTLFQGASYHFPTGERVALVGANGAGKTTMLNILCGLDAAGRWQVLVRRRLTSAICRKSPTPIQQRPCSTSARPAPSTCAAQDAR